MKKYYISFLLLLSACFVFAQNNYKEATIAELIERLKNNTDVLVLDVRSSGEYMDTIPGGRKIFSITIKLIETFLNPFYYIVIMKMFWETMVSELKIIKIKIKQLLLSP